MLHQIMNLYKKQYGLYTRRFNKSDMEILHQFKHGNAMMNICHSTSFGEKVSKGEYFCHYSDKNGTFIQSDDWFRKNIKESEIPLYEYYCEFIERCLEDLDNLDDELKQKYDRARPLEFSYDIRIINNNKLEFTDSEHHSRDNLKKINNYLKEKLDSLHFSKITVECDEFSDKEYVTIDYISLNHEYKGPAHLLWKPFKTTCVPYNGLDLFSVLYYMIAFNLSFRSNPFRSYGIHGLR